MSSGEQRGRERFRGKDGVYGVLHPDLQSSVREDGGLCDFAEFSDWKTDVEVNDIESWYCVQDEIKDSFSVYYLFLVPNMITDTSVFDKHLPLGKYTIYSELCVRENASMNVCLHIEVCRSGQCLDT